MSAAAAKSLQSCPTLCNPRDSSPPGSPVPRILQARTREWVAISFSISVAQSVKNPPAIPESICDAGDPGSMPGSGRSPGGGNGNPLQYSCQENLMDRGAWRATVHGVERVGHDLPTKPPTS